VFRDVEGVLQLKKGWRRLTALRQLFEETGDGAFAKVVARIDAAPGAQIDRYIDMVEENVIRDDLTFAEMAQVVIEAAADPEVEESDAEVLLSRLYGSLHKMKRSYIRSFVILLSVLGPSLKWPKAVPRNLGVEVVRWLQRGGDKARLAQALSAATSPEAQRNVLERFVSGAGGEAARPALKREKYECRVAEMKITARDGECRIKAEMDFTSVPRDRLEEAIRAFQKVLGAG
jgi:ParB family chromosome partitioning protein